MYCLSIARRLRLAVLCGVLGALATASHGYEADVHHGLTKWLALQAGYPMWQADALSLGNARVDSGLMSTLNVVLEYACLARDATVARRVQERHYPSSKPVPAPADARPVEKGSASARAKLHQTITEAKGKEAQYLGLYGAALHPLQDSWSHDGVPSAPPVTPPGIVCDPSLFSGPPRGGDDLHAGDHTASSVERALEMSKATYEALQSFPPVDGAARQAWPWPSIEAQVRAFASAKTKSEKHAWFVKSGIQDTGFLEATTLPDGKLDKPFIYDGRQLPQLAGPGSRQQGVDKEAIAFFDSFIAKWLSAPLAEGVIEDSTHPQGKASPKETAQAQRANRAQLVARLNLLKMRDHGAASALVHRSTPLTRRELRRVSEMSSRKDALVRVDSLEQAVIPLVALGPDPSPLLPYVLRALPPRTDGVRLAVAVLRLKHIPYDTVALVARDGGAGWQLSNVFVMVDQ